LWVFSFEWRGEVQEFRRSRVKERKKEFKAEGTEVGAQRARRRVTQEHSQEWLCHVEKTQEPTWRRAMSSRAMAARGAPRGEENGKGGIVCVVVLH
jgi:hypothetical protein